MNICDKCGYKQVKNSVFEQHLLTHQIDPKVEEATIVTPESSPEPSVLEIPATVLVEVPVEPPLTPEPVQMVTDEITIRFIKPVEIQINGIHYDGKEVKVKNMSIASEIVRIAREAYGPTILA